MVSDKIPKLIHYCWFGNKEKPKEVIDMIESWKNFNPDYKIIEWNEKNFDIKSFVYTKQAYEARKYAFVTDVVRLYALKTMGGIYMDTDVEVLKSFDNFLYNEAFTGCETSTMCVTGTMASISDGRWISKLLDYYENKTFLDCNNRQDLTTNTTSITNITSKDFGWVTEDKLQRLGSVTIYPSDYFCAKSYHTGKIMITDNTVTIHHFRGSWKSNPEKLKSKVLYTTKTFLIKIFGENGFNKLNRIRKQ